MQETFFLEGELGNYQVAGLWGYRQYVGRNLLSLNIDYTYILGGKNLFDKFDVPVLGHLIFSTGYTGNDPIEINNLRSSIGIGLSLNGIFGIVVTKDINNWNNYNFNNIYSVDDINDYYYHDGPGGGITVSWYMYLFRPFFNTDLL